RAEGGIRMSLVADPAAISAFAYTIGSWAPVCQDAIAYSDQWVGGAGAEDGLYYKFRTAANQVNDTIVTRLRRTYTILSDASGELDNLARYYQQTDEQCAAGFPALSLAAYQDATYVVPPDPGYDVTPLDTSASFANAAVHLPVPSGCDPIPDYVDMIMRQGQIFYAPSDIVIKILTWCNHGKNPLDDVYQHFCGNWNAAESGCQALEYLATLHEQMADSVWQSKNTVMDTWEGNSAEAANYYFKKLISALDDIVPGLRSASASFHEVASGMQLAATAAEGAMTMLADEVLFALADMAISAILAPTGVGRGGADATAAAGFRGRSCRAGASARPCPGHRIHPQWLSE
ncbi:MAG: hypothetical protein FWF75_09050, partial [Propionibacteriaceae bacterium]|nr:hypothetical protein [Propionibacteriaceae bacterium]